MLSTARVPLGTGATSDVYCFYILQNNRPCTVPKQDYMFRIRSNLSSSVSHYSTKVTLLIYYVYMINYIKYLVWTSSWTLQQDCCDPLRKHRKRFRTMVYGMFEWNLYRQLDFLIYFAYWNTQYRKHLCYSLITVSKYVRNPEGMQAIIKLSSTHNN